MINAKKFQKSDFDNCRIYRADAATTKEKQKQLVGKNIFFLKLTIVGFILAMVMTEVQIPKPYDLLLVIPMLLLRIPGLFFLVSLIPILESKRQLYCYVTLKVIKIEKKYYDYAHEMMRYPFMGQDVETGFQSVFFVKNLEEYEKLQPDKIINIYTFVYKSEAKKWNIKEKDYVEVL